MKSEWNQSEIEERPFRMKNDILGNFLFRRSLFDSILELCRTRRKRLCILQEINPRWLQMKKCFFMANWGWDQTLEVKGYVLVVKVQFLTKVWKKEDQCTSIVHFVDRPELPYEVDFSRNRFARNIGFQKSWRFWFFSDGGFGCFRRDFGEFVRILAWNRDGKCC